jgi:hypothetical protein
MALLSDVAEAQLAHEGKATEPEFRS